MVGVLERAEEGVKGRKKERGRGDLVDEEGRTCSHFEVSEREKEPFAETSLFLSLFLSFSRVTSRENQRHLACGRDVRLHDASSGGRNALAPGRGEPEEKQLDLFDDVIGVGGKTLASNDLLQAAPPWLRRCSRGCSDAGAGP